MQKVQKKVENQDILKQSNVVYSIKCICGKKYIGRTGRLLANRIKEHETAFIKKDTTKSALAEHVQKEHPETEEGQAVSFEQFTIEILKRCTTHHETVIAESKMIEIMLKEDPERLINRQRERVICKYL